MGNLVNLLILFFIIPIVQISGLQESDDELSSISSSDSLDLDSQYLFEQKLVQFSNITTEDQLFDLLGVERDLLESRRRNKNVDQVLCQREMRTVEVDPQNSQVGEAFFPGCIRVMRCAGCCDITGRLACTPTKISYQDVKRIQVNRYKRSINLRQKLPKPIPQIVQVEVHEECKCMCKIRPEHCNLNIHVYDSSVCKCNCKNRQNEVNCSQLLPLKFWDEKECECKCRKVQHCPSGTEFSHEICSCEEI